MVTSTEATKKRASIEEGDEQMDNWEKIEAKFLELIEGQEFIGTFVGRDIGLYGEIAVVKDDHGNETKIGGAVIMSRLTPDLVGKRIKIVRLKDEFSKTQKKNYKNYEVFVSR